METHPFALLLRHRLNVLGLTVVEASHIIGCSRGSLFGWLAGEYQPSPSRYADISRGLQCPLRDVVLAAGGIEEGVKP